MKREDMTALAEYLPIYVDQSLVQAGHHEAVVKASNFMRSECFEAVHRLHYDLQREELIVLWAVVDAIDRCGLVQGDLQMLVNAANRMRRDRIAL